MALGILDLIAYWCVLKRRANLTGQQRFRLRDLLRYNLRAGLFGFRAFHITEISLYHALGRLPEPDVAHRFF